MKMFYTIATVEESIPLSDNFGYLLVGIILYLAMIYLRYHTGARIWNLFGVGIIIYFMTMYVTSLPMMITLIGIMLYQLYDTFLGD